MKQLILCVAVFSLILSGIAFAGEQTQAESTIIGPVMQNRYVAQEDIKPGEGELSETSQKLMDQGVIPAVEQQRINQESRVIVQPPRQN